METATAHFSRRCRPFIASAVIASALLYSIAAHTSAASGTERAGAAFTQTRAVAHRRSVRPSYGWPLKPFNRPHPVRANLNDPRNGHGDAKSFHFGIDISAPDGTPVYAVEPGRAFVTRGRMSVAVKGVSRTFGYWHIKPAVRNHQPIRLHQLIGYTNSEDGGGLHVHLAERRGNEYLNPLRPGGIGPYFDRTPPKVLSVEFLRNGREVDASALSGRVDVVAEVVDTTSTHVPSPWSNLPVSAARIRWGISNDSRSVVSQRMVVNSDHWLPGKLYDAIFASGTSQNYVGAPGHYRYYLARGFRASRLPAGISRLRIDATDTRGNRVVARVSVSPA
jgi:murein DD-endopeptidase MepM/ murein hydrolase activator NlpD